MDCKFCTYQGMPETLCQFCKEKKMIDLKYVEGLTCQRCGKETRSLEEILIDGDWVDCCPVCRGELTREDPCKSCWVLDSRRPELCLDISCEVKR